MGMEYQIVCKDCGYFDSGGAVGIGYLYSMYYEITLNNIKEGKRSKVAQKFIKEHPDGAFDCSLSFFVCDKCGEIQIKENLSMYIPKEGCEKIECPLTELEEKYTLYARYPHRCCKCRGKILPYTVAELEAKIKADKRICPLCGGELELQKCGCWD